MPTKRSALKRAARKAYLLELENAVLNAPDHIQKRLKRPSPLSDALKEIGNYGWKGYQFDENGQAIELRKRRSANLIRHTKAVAEIKALAKKYSHIWDSRNAAGIIARSEGISPDTVRRYKRLYPSIE